MCPVVAHRPLFERQLNHTGISCALQVQEDLTEEKKRELEHNAEEPYGENEETVSSVQGLRGRIKP